MAIKIVVSNRADNYEVNNVNEAIEFGREPTGQFRRRVRDDRVSRDQMRAEPWDGNQVRITNLSSQVPIVIIMPPEQPAIAPGVECVLPLPARCKVGGTTFDFDLEILRSSPTGGSAPNVSGDYGVVEAPVRTLIGGGPSEWSRWEWGANPSADQVAHWLERVLEVQRAATSMSDFRQRAARAVVDLVGLDRGLVLLRPVPGKSDWKVLARYPDYDGPGPEYSRTILEKALEKGKTYYRRLPESEATHSQLGVSAVAASPIFDDSDPPRAVAVLYGARTRLGPRMDQEISPLEAQLMQVLAAAVGAGALREKEQTLFEQFFTKELTQALKRDPQLLDGREREVTLLFTDIRNYSGIAQVLSPAKVCRFVQDVMRELTECVRGQNGVVVNYVGDALLAMWNAPVDQPDHAMMACRAALAMLKKAPILGETWEPQIKMPLQFGIGVNTGKVLVGNVGCEYRYKYGPLGHEVNLASRVEGATKQLRVPILITETTKALLGDRFPVRQLGAIKVKGIDEPCQLYELRDPDDLDVEQWRSQAEKYEQALRQAIGRQFSEAYRMLSQLLAEQQGPQYDGPALALLSRVVNQLRNPEAPFDEVLELETK